VYIFLLNISNRDQMFLLMYASLQSALHLHTVWLLTEGDDTRGCGDTIGPSEDEQRAARNMLRNVMYKVVQI